MASNGKCFIQLYTALGSMFNTSGKYELSFIESSPFYDFISFWYQVKLLEYLHVLVARNEAGSKRYCTLLQNDRNCMSSSPEALTVFTVMGIMKN